MRLPLILLCLSLFRLNLKAQDAEEIFQTGNRLDSEGKYTEALKYVNKSLSMDSSLYQRYMFKAELEFKLGMIDEAIIDMGKCIDRCDCPTRKYHVSSYYFRRANLHIHNEDVDSAIKDVDSSIKRNPERWEAYNLRSQLNIRIGEFQKALIDLNKSYSINDNEAKTLILRGQLRNKLGDVEGACNDLTTVVNWGFDEFEEWTNQNCK